MENSHEPSSIVERAKQQVASSSRADSVARTAGWAAIALGASHLLMPRGATRWLAPVPGSMVRLLGLAELAGGVALLRARATAHAAPVQRSITIDAAPDRLHAQWRDPAVLTQLMQPLGTVTADASEPDALRWQFTGPLGRSIEFATRVIEEQPGKLLRWGTADGSAIASAGSLELRPDHPEVGTIVTLRLQLGVPIPQLVPQLFLSKVLRRFKSLVETGEIPNVQHNPAARQEL